jgi:hypothetical protein
MAILRGRQTFGFQSGSNTELRESGCQYGIPDLPAEPARRRPDREYPQKAPVATTMANRLGSEAIADARCANGIDTQPLAA